MKASTVEELKKLAMENTEAFASEFLPEESFAMHCYRNHALADLEEILKGEADPEVCREWNLTPEEWRAGVEMAYTAFSYEIL